MFPYIIPLAPVQAQEIATQLGRQSCTISVYQKSTGLFMDVYVEQTPIIIGVICVTGPLLVPDGYNGFYGDLVFSDLIGYDDPTWDGLGSRFQLFWFG